MNDPALEDLILPDILPVLPLRDAVIFPFAITPLSVGPDVGTAAIDHALAEERMVALVGQRNPDVDDPGPKDLFEVGIAASIMRMLKLPDGRTRILVQGLTRIRVDHIGQTEPFLEANVSPIPTLPTPPSTDELEALARTVVDRLERAVHLGRTISPEVVVIAANLEDPGRLADLAASNLDLEVDEAQTLLEMGDPIARLTAVCDHLEREVHVLSLQQDIANQARTELDRSQREYFLRQQLRTIQDELGEGDELQTEVEEYRRKATEKKLPEEACEELEKQIKRLERSHPDSAETTVIRTFLDWLIGLPWGNLSEDDLDLARARAVLDADHYGLKNIKQRMIELLAVRQLKSDARAPILCFVGPPGVGKTSLGRSIARALGRAFVRVSLGGVRDEAEIRGHRRTYVGAMPGRIIQGIHQAGSSNPVFMLDEIDKIGADYRGDPSSALLEVLDPEQNVSFRDHYLGLPYDLSQVLFITTANQLDPIQPAFLDRMEVLRLSGYTEDEKRAIARRHLLPKQRGAHGLEDEHLHLTERGLKTLIRGYTRESGLRNLERSIAALCRKTAITVVEKGPKRRVVGPKQVVKLLGVAQHEDEGLLDQDRVGVATGLAWTAHGGELMIIEVSTVLGKGKLRLTGKLGDVMQESAQAAMTYARGFAERNGLESAIFNERDFHIHAPAGAVPKDGPSAGITIATAVLSAVTDRPINHTLAMTGEITLRGAVLPIGGLKEKALAALTAGITTVIIPSRNERDLPELPSGLRRRLTFRPVEHMDEVVELALR